MTRVEFELSESFDIVCSKRVKGVYKYALL